MTGETWLDDARADALPVTDGQVSAEANHARQPSRMLAFAWAGLPICLLLFVWLRVMSGQASFVASQLCYLAPIALGTVACWRAHRIAPVGLERRAWGFFSAVMLLLLASEGYFSGYQVLVNRSGPPSPSLFDALNLAAAIVIGVALAWVSGVGRLSRGTGLRLLFDGIAFSAITCVAVYRFAAAPFVSGVVWWESARWALYSLVGVWVLLGGGWIAWHAQRGIERRIVWLAMLGLSVYGIGMLLTPLEHVVGASAASTGMHEALFATTYLGGYYVVMLAALTRLAHRDDGWRIGNRRLVDTEGLWTSTLLSLYVLAGVALIGVELYLTHGSEPDTPFYVISGLTATLALVARSGVTAIETAMARNTAELDSLTLAFAGTSFFRRLDETLAERRAPGRFTSLVVFDIDDFSRVNSALGHPGGDALLARVAETALGYVGDRGEIYRLSADEFAIICPGTESSANVLAEGLLEALHAVHTGVDGTKLTASLGVAGCEDGGCDRDELLRRANAAQAWAKYHGKDRTVRYDERITRALGVEDRLREQEDRTGLDMARALASAADARDARNYYHSRNVAALAVMLSEALGLEPEHVRRIEIAAMLHDCGKLGLPDSLLVDVLRSSRQQMAAREHSVLGELLTRSVGMPGVPEWVRSHHERWDGSGYPDGLTGEQVPLESRIIALADAYDAITSGARNRAPSSRAAALQEIDFGMGSRFDPLLAEKFIEVVGQTTSLGWSDEWAVR